MDEILQIKELTKIFYKRGKPILAVDHVGFHVKQGECLSIVGKSGCGKTTLANMITGFTKPDEGSIQFLGKKIENLKRGEMKHIYQHMQMIFQNPLESFNPRIKMTEALTENMKNTGFGHREKKERAYDLLKECGLEKMHGDRYPHQISGGECQRAAIARALASRPKILICDEITASLDLISRQGVVDLLLNLQRKEALTILFISHDLDVVNEISHRILHMEQGKMSYKTDKKEEEHEGFCGKKERIAAWNS